MLDQALFALLHVLVFVYWLGGDLGAFYTSRYLTGPNVSVDRRLMAAKIVSDVDMAPRTALILTLPTGLMLAEARGWIDIGWPSVLAILVASLIWLAIAWQLHIKAEPALKKLDLAVRWLLIAVLGTFATLGLAGLVDLPLFIEIKLLLLAGCIALGLFIRGVLTPLGPALMGLSGPDPQMAETSLAETLNRARPLVLGIWALLITAAILGLWAPTVF